MKLAVLEDGEVSVADDALGVRRSRGIEMSRQSEDDGGDEGRPVVDDVLRAVLVVDTHDKAAARFHRERLHARRDLTRCVRTA